MIVAAVHVSPWVAVPAAVSIVGVLVWYWLHLGVGDVPASRRKIRRTSLIMALVALIAGVIGVSFVDAATHQTAYVFAWACVLLLILAIMLTAAIDMLNSLRLQREQRAKLEIDAAVELHRAIRGKSSSVSSQRGEATSTNGAHRNGASRNVS